MKTNQTPSRRGTVRRTRSGEYLAEPLAQRLGRPRSLAELDEMFPDEIDCREYLAAIRWRRGFVCPHCGDSPQAQCSDRGLWRCPTCDEVSSPATGTLFDRSRLPLRTWYRAVWEVFATDGGADPDRVADALGVARPDFVWRWLGHLRAIMVAASAAPLVGVVEVAKVPIELELPATRQQRTTGHRIVAVAAEARAGELGRVRVQRMRRVDPSAMTSFVTDAVGAGSTVRTGRWSGYRRLRSHGYGHIVACASDELYEGRMKCVQLLSSAVQIWLRSVPARCLEHIDYYLDELVFRLNEQVMCAPADRGALFRRIAAVAATMPRQTRPGAARRAV
ncbi:MAG: IS1595 family transposase [Deltaproteobacteria bacterium]|nr:IS1595 family transposase [Deltaproteobacteria bacterium]